MKAIRVLVNNPKQRVEFLCECGKVLLVSKEALEKYLEQMKES